MSVRIRMKKMGRAHRAFFRICAIDKRSPRDGKVLEELGTYDPSLADTDARAVLKSDRIDHWIGVGAQPSDKVAILIKKYGTNGTHLEAQKAALDILAAPKSVPDAGEPASMPKSEEDATAETTETPAAEEAPAAEETTEANGESPKPEAPAEEAPKAESNGEAAKESTDAETKTEESASTAE